ncbi:MAG: transcriptional repressor LexA [Sedimentisphaerales bacterium]|jgi:repressor LexA
MEPLTEKQQKVLGFIEDRLKNGCPPSQREIAQHFHLTQNAIYQLVRYLKRKGYLTDSEGHRGLRLSEVYIRMQKETEGIPVIGRVAAGTPILAEENIEGYIDLKELFHPSKDTFILKVVGNSMVDEGITDGDYVVVKPTMTVENGQIGVVLLDDEVTIKKIYIQGDKIALKPANEAAGYKTRYIKRGDKSVRIIGRAIGCFQIL